jgi:hypothetical protein
VTEDEDAPQEAVALAVIDMEPAPQIALNILGLVEVAETATVLDVG